MTLVSIFFIFRHNYVTNVSIYESNDIKQRLNLPNVRKCTFFIFVHLLTCGFSLNQEAQNDFRQREAMYNRHQCTSRFNFGLFF